MRKRKKRTHANVNWEQHAEPLMLTVNLPLLPDIEATHVKADSVDNPVDALNTSANISEENARRAIAVDAIIHNAANLAFPPCDASYRQGFGETYMIIAMRGVMGIRNPVELTVLPKNAPFAPHFTTHKALAAFVEQEPDNHLLLTFGEMSAEYAESHASQPWQNLPAHSPKELDAFMKIVLTDFLKLQLYYKPEERAGQKIAVLGDYHWFAKPLHKTLGPCDCCEGAQLLEVTPQ